MNSICKVSTRMSRLSISYRTLRTILCGYSETFCENTFADNISISGRIFLILLRPLDYFQLNCVFPLSSKKFKNKKYDNIVVVNAILITR